MRPPFRGKTVFLPDVWRLTKGSQQQPQGTGRVLRQQQSRPKQRGRVAAPPQQQEWQRWQAGGGRRQRQRSQQQQQWSPFGHVRRSDAPSEKGSLADLGIGDLPKRAATGALVLEVFGPESHAKPDALAKRMRILFVEEKEVCITRPAKRVEIRVRDLDDAVTTENVVTAIASSGGCGPEDIKVGAIRAGANGLGTMGAVPVGLGQEST
ncbi:uncharacterized protein LOC116852465 [Odontomachus brunneus]|uniref:uncharacterized protein LOC116852465 n=1 Tax=Odontomachus brunneus TaxID=486640 RepID=UPI0013F25BC9|nr:uncharacterized protein LOC116852465 [Odontomachus brunneus]